MWWMEGRREGYRKMNIASSSRALEETLEGWEEILNKVWYDQVY